MEGTLIAVSLRRSGGGVGCPPRASWGQKIYLTDKAYIDVLIFWLLNRDSPVYPCALRGRGRAASAEREARGADPRRVEPTRRAPPRREPGMRREISGPGTMGA